MITKPEGANLTTLIIKLRTLLGSLTVKLNDNNEIR